MRVGEKTMKKKKKSPNLCLTPMKIFPVYFGFCQITKGRNAGGSSPFMH